MTLKLNGYSTAQFGKCHEVPVWQTSSMGPFDAWPSGGGGFETFYGFIGGENNQYDPALYDGTTPVEPPATAEEGYHLTEDLTDRAVSWVHQQKALMPDKPFFVYFAPGATHAPHHVPLEWADKYAGKFDDGWDVQRERTFARQKELGVIPADAELTARHDVIPAWEDMPDELKPVLARQMEVYAGFLEHTDHHVGRLIDALESLEVLDDTLIYYIIGDNGASAEGTLNGAFNEMANFNGMAAVETPEFLVSTMGELGTASSYNHYSVGLGMGDEQPTPVDQAGRFTLGRHPQRHRRALAERDRGAGRPAVAVHPRHRRGSDDPRGCGTARADHGQRCAAVARWRAPAWCTASTRPTRRNATTSSTSRCSATAASTTRAGARSPSTRPPGSWSAGSCRRSTTTLWELYDGNGDFSQAHDLAAENPEMLAKLQRLWLIEATKYNVLPLDDRTGERLEPSMAGRPTLIHGTSQLFFPGMGRLSENSVVSMKNKSFSVTADVDVPEGGVEGVIIAQGGRFGGWTVFAKDNRLKFVYNVLGIHHFATESDEPIPSGHHQLRMEFAYDGGGLAKGGDVTLYHDGTAVGHGRVEMTQPMVFSADETTDIGYESGTTVSPDYTAHTSRFTGKIAWVQLDLGKDDNDHFIDPEERVRIAMARQ